MIVDSLTHVTDDGRWFSTVATVSTFVSFALILALHNRTVEL